MVTGEKNRNESVSAQAGWVSPPKEIGGLDHLGVQAPGIEIYGQLLPGITNVTDRIRYYSFHCWLFWQFEKRGLRSAEQWRPMLRRAECLFALIALRHGALVSENASDHGGSVVGANTLYEIASNIEETSKVSLDDFAHDEEAGVRRGRYFKNTNGGFGQYYFGALVQLGLMSGESASHARLVNPAGVALAKAFDEAVNAELFFSVLESGNLGSAELDALSSFCPCSGQVAVNERNMLLGLIMRGAVSGDAEGPVGENVEPLVDIQARASSLSWLQFLCSCDASGSQPFRVSAFRALSYCHSGSDGNLVSIPESLASIAKHWQVYQRHEMFSIALQGLFQAMLLTLDSDPVPVFSVASASKKFWLEQEELKQHVGEAITFRLWLEGFGERLPPFLCWGEENHELSLMSRSVKISASAGIDDVPEILACSIGILSALWSRPENSQGYGDHQFRPGYFDYYPVNLQQFFEDMKGPLGEMPYQEGLEWLSRYYVLDTHQRVALRKLAQQGVSTFRFELSDFGISVRDIPPVAETSPRFSQALQVLIDLGVLKREEALLVPGDVDLEGWLS